MAHGHRAILFVTAEAKGRGATVACVGLHLVGGCARCGVESAATFSCYNRRMSWHLCITKGNVVVVESADSQDETVVDRRGQRGSRWAI